VSDKPNILLVDDDDFIQMVIGESLAKLGYTVEAANNGLEAWNKINLNPKKYDMVLLDKVMPVMDGLTLLKRIRVDENLAALPVVMLTGAGQTEDVVEGLAAGAYYYLIKPATLEVLSGVVKNALEDSVRKRQLLELVGQRRKTMGLLQQAAFSFRTLQEAKELALLLAEVSQNPEKTVSGFSELLINAVEHGNLGITYAEKSQLLAEGRWEEEVESRLQSPHYAENKVEVMLVKSADILSVKITDQGKGFDWEKYLQFEPERAFDLHGRGIAMSRIISFDQLEYLESGNSVVATVQIKKTLH